MSKVSILGSGAWASALANVLSDNGLSSLLYSKNVDKVNEINTLHTNSRNIDIKFSSLVSATSSIKDLLMFSDILLLAVKSDSLPNYISELKKIIGSKKIHIINVIKGFIGENNLTVSSFINNELKDNLLSFTSLVGPSFAIEVVKKDLTCVTAVSLNNEIALKVQQLFSNQYFRVYTSDDLIGCEISSSYKNAIAIGSGILSGLNYGDNARSALITRGLNEIIKFGLFFGAKEHTFYGLSGIGDLLLTCTSTTSRNFMFGYNLAKKSFSSENALLENQTIEGIKTIKVIRDISKKNNLQTPIIDSLYNVIYLNHSISEEVDSLMLRPLKVENE